MNDLAFAYGIGVLSGSRSMLGPALVATRALPVPAQRLLALMAAGEMVADKSTRIPARTTAVPLAGRLLTGAAAAAGFAPRGRRLPAAVVGAVGAVAGTYAWYHLRRFATARLGLPNVVAGVAEDLIAAGAGALLLRRHA